MTSTKTRVPVLHPAKFSDDILSTMARIVDDYPHRQRGPVRVLDPFAGVGRVHELDGLCARDVDTLGVELMPRWAATHIRTIKGDATLLDGTWSRRFDLVVTSPCYGNRFADSHERNDGCSECRGTGTRRDAKNKPGMVQIDATHLVPRRYATADELRCPKCHGTGLSPRRGYKHDYEASGGDFWHDAPIETNAGAMHWGDEYRELHTLAWREARRVLRPSGWFALNIKDHVRCHERQRVSAWHKRTVEQLGFTCVEVNRIPLDGLRHGANSSARVANENVYVFEKQPT